MNIVLDSWTKGWFWMFLIVGPQMLNIQGKDIWSYMIVFNVDSNTSIAFEGCADHAEFYTNLNSLLSKADIFMW